MCSPVSNWAQNRDLFSEYLGAKWQSGRDKTAKVLGKTVFDLEGDL